MRTFAAIITMAMVATMASANDFESYKYRFGVRFSSSEEEHLR